MRVLIFTLLAFAGVVEAQESLPLGGRVLASAEPALVVFEPLGNRQQYLLLPSLTFELSIEPRCDAAAGLRSVLVSIADTRLRLDKDDLDDSKVMRTSLLLPQPQAGQLRVDGFCRRDLAAGAPRLEVKDAFTARLSLRCGDEERESVTYATLPLDVVLECRADAASDESGAPPAQSALSF
jgi:hypothetical protein